MRRAWAQLGDVLAANQKIRQAQLALSASHRIRARHLSPLSEDQQIDVTQAVHARVMEDGTTLHRHIANSRLPRAALSPTFRRITRPRGPIMRKALPESDGQSTDILAQLNEGRITAAPPKQSPERQISLERLRLDKLTKAAVARIPPRPDFVITEPGDNVSPKFYRPGDKDSPEAANFRTALFDLHARFQIELPQPKARPPLDLANAGRKLVEALNPVYTIPKRIRSIIPNLPQIEYVRPSETIVPVMAHPIFHDPMYKPLRDLSSELLIPNLNLIPNNTLTLLETNPKFIEAYMIGLNHEMARELLWWEFPTDQRGSYFRQFWEMSEIINREGRDPKILEEEQWDLISYHLWGRPTPLGSHGNRPMPTGAEPDETRLVLVIRGDLLKKYPTAVIYAQKAKWVDDPDGLPRKIRVLDKSNPKENLKEPIFKAEIKPDLRFIGFNLTVSQVQGDPTPPNGEEPGKPGYFFVIQERPGEPRFGADILDSETGSPPPITEWNQMTWTHLGLGGSGSSKTINLDAAPTTDISDEHPDKNIKWGANAADMAYILYQAPVMVAVHAANMLGETS
jgi:hypothetical protein